MAYEHFPRHLDVLIGKNKSAGSELLVSTYTWQGGFQTDGSVRTPQLFLIENLGLDDFVFRVQQSNDNGVGDAYAAINIRVAGSAVATVTVKPKGRVVASCETFTKKCIALLTSIAAGATDAEGRVVMTYMFGKLDRLERPGIF